MKRIYTILTAILIGSTSFGQTVFQSDLSSWAGGVPTDWMGSRTSINADSVVQQTVGVTYGTSMASLLNTTSSHKRFTTQPVTVVPGETYDIQMWVAATQGDLRTNYYDATNGTYGSYNTYLDMSVESAGNLVMLSQTVTIPAGCTSAEFILSLKNTDPSTAGSPFFVGIIVDSVSISVASINYTPKTIPQIQTSALPNGDSPELGNYVETSGVVTAISPAGYWLQDGVGAWSGVFVKDVANIPSRGDSVTVQGQVDEFFSLTQINNVAGYTNLGAATVMPTPEVVTTTQVNTMEEYEGVLLKIEPAECSMVDAGFGQWKINTPPTTSNDSLLVDDDMFSYTPILGTQYSVVGVGHYSYSERKILPRDAADVTVYVSVKENNLNATMFPNPATTTVNINGVNGTIEIYSINGQKVYNNTINGTLNLNVETFNAGVYFVKLSENNITSTYKLVIK
jgi:hypothetical protein